ncbi:siroheme synthase CysG [Labrys wisconsinensis]|uniref:Uroporphyrin-III C-methyltransferase/precorrin-2 dehydrogenase/sirohydrochlorin ferrochelatase n=1 Tax=Labrys wisconsinensis TaxID=425677 RepID=A0ABU0J4Y9_9HYPH|nr:siroheme synthase CysG [Labrys wisconsinensis]MDQ0469329.1 uroporphyrin-III C-methyltransferase/precorrin-2 dehydrogenase/sirohydrochlorin ferrochelatase [Labrys wisconsinensis]
MSRTPSEAEPGRIAPLSVLPVFYRLGGKRALVAGESAGTAWKAELLAAAGAAVEVYAPAVFDELAEVLARSEGRIRHVARRWSPADLAGAALAVADAADEAEAQAFRDAAKAAGVPVNIVDRPAFCDFQFGSIVNRSPLVVGISTDGASPVFAQAIRARIETLLPDGFRRWAEAAKAWRPLVQSLSASFAVRRRIWERFAREALARPGDEPTESDRGALVAAAAADRSTVGSVVLVGAGPGDPELLTLKAVRALQSADVILHDDLVAEPVLDFARREARRMVVGKRGRRPSCKQDDINALMVSLAAGGKRVVRLKGGDPLVFGRAGEEIAACRAAGIPVEVVPGVTAALGAAARLAVSLTHRDHSRRLQFVTAHSRQGRLPDDLDWKALADPAATTAVYMGKAVLGELAQKLVAAGLDPATPAIIVEYATRAEERIFHASVGTMAGVLAEEALEGPCIMLIGAALAEARPAEAAAIVEEALARAQA